MEYGVLKHASITTMRKISFASNCNLVQKVGSIKKKYSVTFGV